TEMKSEKLPENKLSKALHIKRATLIKVLYPLFIFLILISVYHVIFARRIIPGVYIGRVYVGSLTYPEAKKLMQNNISNDIQPLQLSYVKYTYTLKPEDVALVYNIDSSVTRAFEVGRTGNLIIDTKDKLAGFVKKLPVRAFYDMDQDALSAKFAQIQVD